MDVRLRRMPKLSCDKRVVLHIPGFQVSATLICDLFRKPYVRRTRFTRADLPVQMAAKFVQLEKLLETALQVKIMLNSVVKFCFDDISSSGRSFTHDDVPSSIGCSNGDYGECRRKIM
jgi:hypothetical protein